MPNWCYNSTVIKHKDPVMLARALNAFENDRFLQEFIPVPQDLIDTVSGSFPDGSAEEALHKIAVDRNLAEYGYPDWYQFCINEWGTKWDIKGEALDIPDGLQLTFESAWSPPIEAYRKLAEMGFEVAAMYYEPGMGFCGDFTTENDDIIYQLDGDSAWVEENIPSHINDEFAISEQMELDELAYACEEDEDDDEDDPLIDRALSRIKADVADGDLAALAELLTFIPEANLKVYLGEDDAEDDTLLDVNNTGGKW
jgi:Ferredoxin-like domain in Api92-like protein